MIVEKKNHNHHSCFVLFINIEYKKHIFEISFYQRDGYAMYLQINLFGSRGACKDNKAMISLLDKNGYSYQGKWIEYPELIFYAKDISEPTFELFDEEKFSFFLTEYTKEIKKALQLIEDNKTEII